MISKSIKIFLILFIYSVSLFGQSVLKNQLRFADSLFTAGNYFDAVTEYKRLAYFDTRDEFAFTANYKTGLAYKTGGFYDNAVKYFSTASLKSRNEVELAASKLQIIRTNILRKTTQKARELLNQLEHRVSIYSGKSSESTYINSGLSGSESVDSRRDTVVIIKNNGSFNDTLHYWRGWTYIFEDKWDSAAVQFNNISSEHELKKLCENVANDKFSVTFVKVISAVLPGSGQIYTGNYFSGFMSLSWNIFLGYVTGSAFASDRVFDGIMTGGFLWLRFYNGNLQNAEKFALEQNIKTANKALLYLQNEYKGIKP